jgi:DNA-binding CsgD family transcriptional regulator
MARNLTVMQTRVVAEYVRTGSQKAVAHTLGISVQTVKNHLSAIYGRLETQGILQTLGVLGWITTPGDPPRLPPCGHVGVCTLDEGHDEDHVYRG